MFGKIAAFELRYQLRSPILYVSFLIFFLLTFGAMTIDGIQIGSSDATNVNSPFAISITMLIMSLFGIFIPTAMLASVVLRDAHFKMDGIFYSTPIGKIDYLGGRFLGAFAITALAFLSVPLGILVGSLMPWLDPVLLGPFRPQDYLYAFFILGLPNLLMIGAVMFTVANITRSNMATYTALVAFLIFYLTVNSLLNDPAMMETIAILDPFGLTAWGEATRYWTAFDRNARLVPLEGLLLANRLLWLGVALALIVLNMALFSFRKSAGLALRRRRREQTGEPDEEISAAGHAAASRPRVASVIDGAARWAQFRARTGYEIKGILKSITFWVLMALGLFFTSVSLLNLGALFGTEVYPVTRIMVEIGGGTFSIIPVIVLIYFASELVWRDRNLGAHEIIDSTPAPNWVFVVSKLLAMFVVIIGLMFVALITSIAVQLIKGFYDIDLGLYFYRMILMPGIGLSMLAALSIFFQVIFNNRYLGMLAMVGYLIMSLVFNQIGWQHNLYQFSGTPGAPLSDMNGSGHFMTAVFWFNLYWGALSIALLVLAYLLWNRGALTPIRRRVMALPRRIGVVSGGLLAASLAVFATTGVFIFYNTNILNDYTPSREAERLQVAYEERYRQYEDLPQPKVTDVSVEADIYPHELDYEMRGRYVIENKTDAPIEQVHVTYNPEANVYETAIEGAKLSTSDTEFNYYIFDLDTPMAPGDTRTLTFRSGEVLDGFRNSSNMSPVVYNGSFIHSSNAAPTIGFNRAFLLQDRSKRRKHDLEPIDRLPKLEDEEAQHVNPLAGDADWVNFHAVVSTSPEQIAIAPGYLQREWTEGGRRYFEYGMDAPILNFYSFLSADYALAEDEWNDVALEIYYYPEHDYNLSNMFQSMKDSLAYFSENFGPYQYDQIRILEFPAYATFAQSFPNTVPFSEGIGFIADVRDEEDVDYVYYVTAHELAHQWWGHQVVSGNVQGSTMMIESFAQYSSLMVMKQRYGEHQIRKFLKYELDSYLSARGSEQIEELPLYRVENQQYIHYRKGSVVMYALQDYLGEDVVNRALQRLVDEYQYVGDPYPTTLDFLRILREEADDRWDPLITDLFENITLYDLTASNATASQRSDGRWDVSFDITARKLYADGQGEETEAPLDLPIDIGVFSEDPEDVAEGDDHVLYFEKQPVETGERRVRLVVDEEPTHVGVDPYNKLVDRNSDDNLTPVSVESRGS